MDCYKISVIIPVYNVESYLRECVDSVLRQSYGNLEVILVDDGSTDHSPQICDEYQNADNRVTVIHQKNGGAAKARNSGIRMATGYYVTFLDSDDFWADERAMERLVKRIAETHPDVLNYSYVKYYEEPKQTVPQFKDIPPMPLGMTKEEQVKYLIENSLYIASACNKLFCLELLKDHLFCDGKTAEDIAWCARLLTKAESFDFVCENFYYYRQRSGSVTHSMAEKACIDLTDNILACVKAAEQAPENMKNYIYTYTAYQYSTFFAVQAMAGKCPTECKKELSKYRWLLNYHGSNRKVTCLFYGCKLLGFSGLCRMVCLTKKLWN